MSRAAIYLPDDLTAALKRAAVAERRTEADIIRAALRRALQERKPPHPKVPLVPSGVGDETAAERVDELLDGFGSG